MRHREQNELSQGARAPRDLPVGLFVSYSHKDANFLEQFKEHADILQREGLIKIRTDLSIGPGDDWFLFIQKEMEKAKMFVLLVSASFLASDFCWSVELQRSIDRHRDGTGHVVPVVVRPCAWRSAPFGNLQSLPKSGRPVSSWSDADEAWLNVVKNIRDLAQRMRDRVSLGAA